MDLNFKETERFLEVLNWQIERSKGGYSMCRGVNCNRDCILGKMNNSTDIEEYNCSERALARFGFRRVDTKFLTAIRDAILEKKEVVFEL